MKERIYKSTKFILAFVLVCITMIKDVCASGFNNIIALPETGVSSKGPIILIIVILVAILGIVILLIRNRKK